MEDFINLKLKQFGYGAAILCALSALTGCDGDSVPVWTIEGDDNLWVQRELPVSETDDPVIARFYYDVKGERIYLQANVYPAGEMLTVEAVESSPVQFYGIDAMGLSRESEDAKDTAAAIELDPADAVLLSSGLLRSVGGTAQQQPFGSHKLVTTIDEVAYEVERNAGFPFFGEPYTEQLGDGTIRLELRDPANRVIFSLEDNYEEKSGDYSATFTPDGRYLLVVLPDAPDSAAAQLPGSHRLVVVGSLPIEQEKLSVIKELSLSGEEKKAHQARELRRQQYRDGKISPEEYYGGAYTSAKNRITGCREVLRIIGEIESLRVHESVLDFGNPITVGKVFTFDYIAATGKGEVQAIALEPEHEFRWEKTYRPYLVSVDIRTGSGVSYANCP